jgi:predicted oxidoreductase
LGRQLEDADLTSVSWDVVIAGSGVAGLAAAVEAAQRGMAVLVLESRPSLGGASAISTGGSCLVGTSLQARNGIKDSLDLALRDWREAGGPAADMSWARRYLAESCSAVFRWCEQLGVTWSAIRHQEGNSVPRWHLPAGGGRAVVEALLARCSHLGVAFAASTLVTDILLKDGRCYGVAAAPTSGRHIRLPAKAVIICSGGFTNNRDMLLASAPELATMSRFLCGGSATSTGSGHVTLQRIGASFSSLDQLWIYPVGTPDPRDPHGMRGLVVRGIRSEIWVNSKGERFTNEDLRGGSSGTSALLRQPGQTCWGILGAEEARTLLLLNDDFYGSPFKLSQDAGEEFWQTSHHAWRAGSLHVLADATGLPRDPLIANVERHNESLRSGAEREREFGRSLVGLRPIHGPPFFAIQYLPVVQKNLGGVRTDHRCHVERAGKPVPNLYAAGETAGMAGGCINGKGAIEGTMFGPSIYSGRIAGRAAALDTGHPVTDQRGE